MKKPFILILLPLWWAFTPLNAQRFVGWNDVFIQAGYSTHNEINASIGFELFFGEGADNSFYSSLSYGQRKAELEVSKLKVDLTDYVGSVGIKKYFIFNSGFYPYVGGGLMMGYENLKRKDVRETVFIDRKSGLLYGLKSDVGIEYLFAHTSLYLNVEPRYEFHFKEFSATFQLGLKYFF